jgi:ERCC4-related helicase
MDDDALGEELQVIWELEPGARIFETNPLPKPDGFDDPQRLDVFLDAVRWGATSTADMRALQAPFRSGIEIEDYQLDPLVRAVQMPRVSLLIADDVGLGKTIEAGLVIQELIVRNRARTVLVVCPAGLQIHWRDQMRDKFGLEFRIVDRELMKHLRRTRGIHVNPWTHFPRLITSIDFVKRDRPMRLFREIFPEERTYPRPFDILVVDEAHNVAPAGSAHYVQDSMRTQAIRTLAPQFEHKLFLTATPHNGYQESFSALLELLDRQRFARGVMPNRQQLEAVMVRRLKSDFVDEWDGKPRFPQRRLRVIEVDYSDEEKQVHRWLKEYTALRQKNAESQQEHFATEFVLKLLKKRLFSSPAAFATTLAKHEESLREVAQPERRKSHPHMGILRRQIAQIDEDYADDEAYEVATQSAVDTATRLFHVPSPREQWLLDQMRRWAEKATAQRDCKTDALVEKVREIVKPDGVWSEERVILFTEYRATQKWLQEVLVTAGLGGQGRLMTFYGGMDRDEREAIKAAFQADPEVSPVRILLATDAASEGIDLQRHCHRLIHVEIPWNPNRLEQRNGRIDRHGQRHDPQIYHFVSQGYEKRGPDSHAVVPGELEADLEFLMRAAEKVEQIREDLGKVGPVIAAQVEEAMVGKRATLETQWAEDEAGGARKMLKFERDLRQRVQALYEQLQETRHDLHLTPDHIQEAVEVALELAGQLPLKPVEVPGASPAFELPTLTGSWKSATEGLTHPHTGEVRPIVFDHELAAGRDDVVLAHLNHRLVQMALHLLRAEIWDSLGDRGLHRVTVRRVPDHALKYPAVVAHARLVVVGREGTRLHEEIITAGGRIREGRFRRLNVGEVEAALEAATDKGVSDAVRQRLQSLWPDLEDSLKRSLEVRMEDKVGGMERLLQERADKEASDIEAVLTELAQAIREELATPEYAQLELWSRGERDQLQRDVSALRARLDKIPEEITNEQAAIYERYADPQPRMFPVAVTFLVPERFA